MQCKSLWLSTHSAYANPEDQEWQIRRPNPRPFHLAAQLLFWNPWRWHQGRLQSSRLFHCEWTSILPESSWHLAKCVRCGRSTYSRNCKLQLTPNNVGRKSMVIICTLRGLTENVKLKSPHRTTSLSTRWWSRIRVFAQNIHKVEPKMHPLNSTEHIQLTQSRLSLHKIKIHDPQVSHPPTPSPPNATT